MRILAGGAQCVLLLLAMSSMLRVEASTRNIGETCSYDKNCQSHVEGAGPSWENNRVTCAVPASQAPETCGSNEPHRSNFGGICKAVGTLATDEYACECGVHKGKCPAVSPHRRIFWSTTWIQDSFNIANGIKS